MLIYNFFNSSQHGLEFRNQFRIRASLRILNSVELRSSWSTNCILGTRGRFLACGGIFGVGRRPTHLRTWAEATSGERSVEFAEKYRSLRVQAPIRHKVLRGIKMSVVNICNMVKKLMNGRDSFLRKARKKWICGRLKYVSAITKSSI